MTAVVPAWAQQLDMQFGGGDGPSAASAEGRTVVLIDASLLREHDPAWVHQIEATLGSVVAICANPNEASWARTNGVRRSAPASLLGASAEVALDVLEDVLATKAESKTDLERFMCDAVHEFRTPLTVISEFAGLCEDGIGGPLTERQESYIGYIQAAVERMGEQFDDYRDGLRMRLGTLHHESSTDSLSKVVESASKPMGAQFIGDPSPLSLDGVDVKRLSEAVKRLIAGAQKLSAKDDHVDVEVLEPRQASGNSSPCAEIHVSYRGVVLSEEDVTVMQEGTVMRSNGFYRSIARVFGLGVSMAHLFLAQSGGSIRVELREGVGGAFIAQVPVKTTAASRKVPVSTVADEG